MLDASNGIGGLQIKPLIEKYIAKHLKIHLINESDTQYLNDKCGSEYVQKEKKQPRNLENILIHLKDLAIEDVSFLSFDGDADRTVY